MSVRVWTADGTTYKYVYEGAKGVGGCYYKLVNDRWVKLEEEEKPCT